MDNFGIALTKVTALLAKIEFTDDITSCRRPDVCRYNQCLEKNRRGLKCPTTPDMVQKTVHDLKIRRFRHRQNNATPPPSMTHVCGSGTVMMFRITLFRFAVPPPPLKSAMKNVHTPFASVF